MSRLIFSAVNPVNFRGHVNFVTEGSHQWAVPPGVTSVSVVCVAKGEGGSMSNIAITNCSGGFNTNRSGGGGGALRYVNDIAVTPGQVISIQVGSTSSFGSSVSAVGRTGGTGTGGNGGEGGDKAPSDAGYGGAAGGGGAGGFTGNGGDGGDIGQDNATSGTGGGGNGGQSVAEPSACRPSGTPSLASNGGSIVIPGVTGAFGGGGRGGVVGAGGVVRVLWPGDDRQYPDTKVDNGE